MLIAFFKPYNVLSQFTREVEGQRTLSEFGFPPDVYGIGRLDRDSEGLLLLSAEASWTKRLISPLAAHPRIYWVQVEGQVEEKQLRALRSGVQLKDFRAQACQVTRLEHIDPEQLLPTRIPPVRYRAKIPTTWLELTLTEGKNRQVRRMTAAVGCPTLRLVRVRIGGLDLFSLGLQPGEWRALTEEETSQVLNASHSQRR